jgi:peroxiredoxin Q/BCP
MAKIAPGKKVPDFSLPATGGRNLSLSSLRGRDVVLYFYPKDDTPGCTLEGKDFRDLHPRFKALGVVILGVSRDSLKSHDRFCQKYSLDFDLLSDEDEKLCKLFDVIKMKNMYGKKVRGIERSTFLIGKDGVLRREWRKVKVEGHAAEVLDAVTVTDPAPAKPKAKKTSKPKKKAKKKPARKAVPRRKKGKKK